jgi:hypothetical protein
MNDVPNAFEFGVSLAAVERVSDRRVGEVDPGDDAFNGVVSFGQVEKPPRFFDYDVGLDHNGTVEAMVRKDGFEVLREIVAAENVVTGRHPRVLKPG